MAWNNLITEQTLDVGEYNFGPLTIPTSVKGVHVRCTRIDWPDTGQRVISASVDLSMDDGDTWKMGYTSWSSAGGISTVSRFGDPPGCSGVRMSLPPGNKRKIMIHLTVHSPITTIFQFETV